MARMNPKRRRYAKQAALIASIVREHGPSHDDSAKLQQGKVANAMSRRAASYVGMITPRAKGEYDGTGSMPKPRSPVSKPNNRECHVDILRLKAQVLLLARKNREG